MNKFIVFSNIKGGVGKSTLSIAFAHYLTAKGEDVQVIDVDIQKSIVNLRERDIKRGNKTTPWDVVSVFNLQKDGDICDLIPDIKKMSGWIVADCPGNMESDRLIPIFEAADAIVIPLSYDSIDIDVTLELFVPVVKKLNKTAKLIFVPNRINEKDRKNKDDVDSDRNKAKDKLRSCGWVTPRIKDSVVFNTTFRFDTVHLLDEYQQKAVAHTFDSLMEQILK